MSDHNIQLLNNAFHNQSLSFSEQQRRTQGLSGLLPPRVQSWDQQIERTLLQLSRKTSDIGVFVFLQELQQRSQELFFRLICSDINRFVPIVYTPTVGEACLHYSHLYRSHAGMFISLNDQGRISEVLKNWPQSDIRAIVVTDGSRILGHGDIGANGMAIPIGKLSLFTAFAGVQPEQCLPICIDVGCDTPEVISDPLYIGLPQKRIERKQYEAFMDEFIEAVQQQFPDALLQFEDFRGDHAHAFLTKYQNTLPCFNDDIQGTASVVLSGLIRAQRILDIPFEDVRFLFAGAGSASLGIASLIVDYAQSKGLDHHQVQANIWMCDSRGLVNQNRSTTDAQRMQFAQNAPDMSLKEALLTHRPQILIGATARAGVFDQEVIHTMASHNPKPVIMALSNPTHLSECTAHQAFLWSNGRCLFASGSPFQAVTISSQKYHSTQANNAYIFPGLALGAILSQSRTITNEMFILAAERLAQFQANSQDLYPPLEHILDISKDIALHVADHARAHGLARHIPSGKDEGNDQGSYENNWQNYVYKPVVESLKKHSPNATPAS